jgi:hypothetical protein
MRIATLQDGLGRLGGTFINDPYRWSGVEFSALKASLSRRAAERKIAPREDGYADSPLDGQGRRGRVEAG